MDWLLREPAAMVVLETGANDGLRGLDVDSTRANLEAIVQLVKQHAPGGADLPRADGGAAEPWRRLHASAFTTTMRWWPSREGVTLVPFLLDGVAGVRALNQGDGIHPTEKGAVLVAKNLWPSLGPAMARLAKGSKPG